MIRKFVMALLLCCAYILYAAPQPHSVTLYWDASIDSTVADPGAVVVYRFTGACPSSIDIVTWTVLTTAAPAGGPYADIAVSSKKTYCYVVTAVIDGIESAASNSVQVTIPTGSPNIKGATIK